MASVWISVLAMLLAFVNGTKDEGDTFPCAVVRTSTPMVALGSSVAASCIIGVDCPLTKGQDIHVEWHLGQRLIPSTLQANGSSRISRVVIPSFTDTRGYLTCCVQAFPCQIVGGVEITAGFPPPVPQNLSCLTNLTTPSTLSCQWNPGPDTHLPTQYTLHTKIRELQESNTYEMPPGVHHYTIPRSGFGLFSDMDIFVRTVNALGQATSEPLLLEPMGSAKFDPPKILKVQAEPNRYGCLRISWSLSQHQTWVLPLSSMNMEVRLKPAGSNQWSKEPVTVTSVKAQRPVEVGNLLHGTEYQAQIRLRYHQSPWSDWSNSHAGVTQEKAPTGRVDSWMKAPRELRQKHLGVHLFWKPSEQFRANGKNVSYIVSLQRPPGGKGQVCATLNRHCAFHIPRGVRKVFLSAVNAAGISNPTEVRVLKHKALAPVSEVSFLPHGERSLLVQWTTIASSDITGYVVEWRPLNNMDPSLLLFDHIDRNQSSTLLSDGIEPYTPYQISVYPKYKDGIGQNVAIQAYSRQKAPSAAPNLTVSEIWHSRIVLAWDEIPINQRNGIVQSYRIFYWVEEGNKRVVNTGLAQRRVVLRDLNPGSLYKAFIMVSTDGGSLNGSTIFLKTEHMDALAIVMIVIPAGVAVSLLVIITVLACFHEHEWLKMRFWPMVPDPANSSIKRWTTSDTIQDAPIIQDFPEPGPVYLSHLSLLDLDLSKKGLEKRGGKIPDDLWLDTDGSEDTSDLGESICGSPLSPGYTVSQQDSVPYATVIFAGSYTSQPPTQTHTYLRSESTQPLLEAEEPSSPKEYENMLSHRMPAEQVFFKEYQDDGPEKMVQSIWDDFPLLRALAMDDIQSESYAQGN